MINKYEIKKSVYTNGYYLREKSTGLNASRMYKYKKCLIKYAQKKHEECLGIEKQNLITGGF